MRTSNPRLYTIPNAGHCCPVEHGPQASPDTETGTADNGEGDVICRSDATSQTDEARGDGVSDPDADPGLPP